MFIALFANTVTTRQNSTNGNIERNLKKAGYPIHIFKLPMYTYTYILFTLYLYQPLPIKGTIPIFKFQHLPLEDPSSNVGRGIPTVNSNFYPFQFQFPIQYSSLRGHA